MNSKEQAKLVVEAIENKKGNDPIVIDIAAKSSIADYLIVGSANSERQIGALADEVEEALAKEDIFAKQVEGKKESGWILIDYGDILVNVMTEETRSKYNIEKVWADCERVPFGMGEK